MHSTFVPDEARMQTSGAPFRPQVLRHEAQNSPVLQSRYNLFRSRHDPGLHCAVPEDRPVPRFIEPETWQFVGLIEETDPLLLGFDRKAATVGVRFNGFYLFVAFARDARDRSHPRSQPAGSSHWLA